jgi:outer membrane lipoprotein-sorting protein
LNKKIGRVFEVLPVQKKTLITHYFTKLNMMKAKIILVAICAVFTTGLLNAQPDPETLLKNADEAVRQYNQLSFTFHYKERFRGRGIVEGDMDMKIMEGPDKMVYVRARKPEKAQLIWGVHEGKVWVNKGLKLKLNPFNNLLMKNSHHPLYRAGFQRTRDIIMQTYEARKEDVNNMVQVKGSVTFDGRDCWHVVLTDHNYRIVDYVVKDGDNLVSLAEARAIPEMRILELNPKVKGYFGLTPGETIRIPTSYGKITILYVDKQTYLPLYQRVEDDLGLFTEYKHYDMNVNPGLTESDFVWQ